MYFKVTKMKGKEIRLAPDEFQELPVTHVDSLSDYNLFEDYLQSDMIIEVTRLLKYQLMTMVQKKQNSTSNEHLKLLQEHCQGEILRRDEFIHYQDLIQELKMDEKWSASQTDKYLERSINELPDQLIKAGSVLEMH